MWQYNYTPDPDELMHYGVKGMKWKKKKMKVQSDATKSKLSGYLKNRRGKLRNAMDQYKVTDMSKRVRNAKKYGSNKAKAMYYGMKTSVAAESFNRNLPKAFVSKKGAKKAGKSFVSASKNYGKAWLYDNKAANAKNIGKVSAGLERRKQTKRKKKVARNSRRPSPSMK